jgi:hypothetical protein
VFASVSLNVGGWENCFLVDIQITGSSFDANFNSLAIVGLDISPTFDSFHLGFLNERLVIDLQGGIFPAR